MREGIDDPPVFLTEDLDQESSHFLRCKRIEKKSFHGDVHNKFSFNVFGLR